MCNNVLLYYEYNYLSCPTITLSYVRYINVIYVVMYVVLKWYQSCIKGCSISLRPYQVITACKYTCQV